MLLHSIMPWSGLESQLAADLYLMHAISSLLQALGGSEVHVTPPI